MTGASRLEPVDDAQRWDQLVQSFAHASPLQSWAWGDLKAAHGWQPARFQWQVDGELAGAILVLRRRLSAGLSLHYAPRGPLLRAPGVERLAPLLRALRGTLDRGSVVLKVDPEWQVDEGWTEAVLRAAGLRPSPHEVQHRSTYLVDISGSDDEALNRLKPVTRYNIRYGARHGVTVHSGTDAPTFAQFFALLTETAQRNNFRVRAEAYYRDLLAAFARRDQAQVFIAERAGTALSAILTVVYGSGLYYLFGGSNLRDKELKPNYLLHWEAIRYARGRGCTRYDMWGIPLDPQPGHPGYGYYVFKTKFNGQARRFVGMWDYPLRPGLYQGFCLAERFLSRSQPEFV
jgi:lipid II:glycine glycyltransferase (peptidoglycan interpeptide bridge formation enzyme)